MAFEIDRFFRPEMSDDWIAQIGKTNQAIDELKKRKIDFIALPDPPDPTNKEHLTRSYDTLMQAHLRRFLCLIDCIGADLE